VYERRKHTLTAGKLVNELGCSAVDQKSLQGGLRGVRVSHPLPRYLRDEQLSKMSAVIQRLRDHAMFMLMLRCGLQVNEVAS
jgi:hypothetical protein